MKRLLWVIILSPALLLSGCCEMSPLPIAEYQARLQTLGGPTPARGEASAVLFSNDELSVTGVYQGLSGTVSSVRVNDAGGRQLCDLEHEGGVEGTFGGTCTLAFALVNELNAGRIWVFVSTTTATAQELGGAFERRN
jgi:hypothetical protein